MFHHITALQLQDFNPGDAASPTRKFASQHCTITAVHTVVTPANSKRQVLHTPKEAEGHCIFSHQHHAICARYNILQVLV